MCLLGCLRQETKAEENVMKPTGEGMEVGSVSNKTFIEANQTPMGDGTVIRRGSGRDQEQSEHQEREWLASLGTMAAVFAHEVANPLAGISCSLEFVEGELKNNPTDHYSLISVVQSAMREVDRLSSLLHEFRSLAPLQSLDLKPIVLAEIIEEVLACQRTLYEAAGINVKFEFENDLPAVRLDPAKIKQVILNLCKNSVEAMPNGGCLTLSTYHSAPMVVLEIRDTGTGIPSELEVFRLFNTTKPGGSGFGLPLVQRIVSAHKGSIQHTSRCDHGTTFRISLPAGV